MLALTHCNPGTELEAIIRQTGKVPAIPAKGAASQTLVSLLQVLWGNLENLWMQVFPRAKPIEQGH